MAVFLLVALSTFHIASSLRPGLGVCRASGYLPGKAGHCEKSNDPDCRENGKRYTQYHCSPPITTTTKAVLTLNSFEKGKDGGGPSECDNSYHSDKELVVALSTGWFENMARCGHCIKITAHGKSVYAKVVDECDSVYGCDDEHNYEPPCANNIVDASPAVWNALGLDQNVGMEDITFGPMVPTPDVPTSKIADEQGGRRGWGGCGRTQRSSCDVDIYFMAGGGRRAATACRWRTTWTARHRDEHAQLRRERQRRLSRARAGASRGDQSLNGILARRNSRKTLIITRATETTKREARLVQGHRAYAGDQGVHVRASGR